MKTVWTEKGKKVFWSAENVLNLVATWEHVAKCKLWEHNLHVKIKWCASSQNG